MLNKAMIIGNLGNDPDMRYMTNGDPVANFSVATSERWKDKQTGEQKEKTEWHRCAAFGRLAEIVGEYLRKGSKVYVEGSIQTRKYTDKDQIERYSTEIKVREMKMLDPKSKDAGQGQRSSNTNAGQNQPPAGDGQPGPDDFDDDIPF